MPFDSTSSVVQWSRPAPVDADAALLDLLGPTEGLHVLVIGPGSLGPVLALHGRGAASVTALRAGSRVHAGAADAALVLHLSDAAMAGAAIASASRAIRSGDMRAAIRPLNCIVLQLAPDAPSALLPRVRQCLAESGLSVGHATSVGGCTVLLAGLPLLRQLRCA